MKGIRRVIYSYIDRKFLHGCSSYNSLAVRKKCRSKLQARRVFADNDIPMAEGGTFFLPWKVFRCVKRLGFPLVIKPNVSGFSRGSHFPITNYSELWKACLLVKIWWPVSVFERYLEGKNYRVTVVPDDIMSVIRRYPPFVDGDGHSSIDKLIDIENQIRQEMQLYPVISPIKKDAKIKRYLKKTGRDLKTVPAKDERVHLFNRVALAPGGVVETVDKRSMHPENRAMFERVLSLFGANILGIDAIFEKGIETSYREQECILLEVNSRPYLKMHDFPRYGEKEDLSSYYEKLNRLIIDEADLF